MTSVQARRMTTDGLSSTHSSTAAATAARHVIAKNKQATANLPVIAGPPLIHAVVARYHRRIPRMVACWPVPSFYVA